MTSDRSYRSVAISGSIAVHQSIAITSSVFSRVTRSRSLAACSKWVATITPDASAGTESTRADILHVRQGNPRATIVGDLTDPAVLPESAFDCIVLTQTLHLIYDVRLAVARLYRALAPGGVVLVTAPGISQIDRGEWGNSWFWSFTTESLSRLFKECFRSSGR